MTEVHEDLRGDTKLQAKKNNNQSLSKSLYQDTRELLQQMGQQSRGKNGWLK